VSLVNSMIGVQLARVGFERLQPVSVIETEIAKDPESPIAVAHAIGRKNRQEPGARGLTTQALSLIPVLVMVAVDPRRRPRTASVAYGVALMATMSWILARSPAFAPMFAGPGAAVIALGLTIGAALVAAALARALSSVLAWEPSAAT
jgi:hypothetical protein